MEMVPTRYSTSTMSLAHTMSPASSWTAPARNDRSTSRLVRRSCGSSIPGASTRLVAPPSPAATSTLPATTLWRGTTTLWRLATRPLPRTCIRPRSCMRMWGESLRAPVEGQLEALRLDSNKHTQSLYVRSMPHMCASAREESEQECTLSVTCTKCLFSLKRAEIPKERKPKAIIHETTRNLVCSSTRGVRLDDGLKVFLEYGLDAYFTELGETNLESSNAVGSFVQTLACVPHKEQSETQHNMALGIS